MSASPILDFANPVKTFTGQATQWTTTVDGYLYGSCGVGKVDIDGKEVSMLAYSGGSLDYMIVPTPLKVKAGSIINYRTQGTTAYLYYLKEKQ